ncbi:MAG TPA: DinB family protein [Thermoanaerobaculia bacterium]
MAATPFLKKASTNPAEAMLQEFIQEAAITRRVLDRVPEEQLAWRPDPKSMSLGMLALHIASSPAQIIKWVAVDSVDLKDVTRPQAQSKAEILQTHQASVDAVLQGLRAAGEEGLLGAVALRKNGATFMTMPKLAVVRTLVINHCIHHRGQLTLYLRLLGVPVPAVYGASADEAPFQRT